MTKIASHITAQKTPEHYKTSKMFSDRLVMRLQASGNQAQSGEEIASGDDLRSTRLGAHAVFRLARVGLRGAHTDVDLLALLPGAGVALVAIAICQTIAATCMVIFVTTPITRYLQLKLNKNSTTCKRISAMIVTQPCYEIST